ncbi:MAG: arginine--tRNA ligase [Endomicrobia bacterium]|nr:arginine--tRNA ligase [Endomicrobiia bacterium]MCX7940925.1 arginine--tRNA ligase [Endomicrobiia bacterium]MDW8055675.1 arginine--tRNA ligase [Elusimicrobiota bacterium]
MKEKVLKVLNEAITNFGWNVQFDVNEPPSEIKADLASNLPIVVSKKYGVSPEEVFGKVKDYCFYNFRDYMFKELTFSSPGFINIVLSKVIFYEELKQILIQQKKYPKVDTKDEKVLIEFVSANPTGPLHIGHGRCAVLGDVLGNLLRKLGYNVQKEYYVNDRGRQIDVLTASVVYTLIEQKYEIVDEKIRLWSEDVVKETKYKGEYIKGLAAKLQDKFGKISESNINDVKKFIVDTIMGEIELSLKKFNVNFDNYIYETSLYETKLVDEINQLMYQNKLVETKDGAVWFKSAELTDDKDRVIIKSTGEPTYFFSDIIYHYNKVQRNFNWLINIWGTDHHGYVERLKSACKVIFDSIGKNVKLDILLYQLVSLIKGGQRVAMSTREGKFVTLDEVIAEVGTDVTRFFLLTKSPNAHLDFDLDLAKEHSLKNPVYYIQYAHTRCCGIIREVGDIINVSDIESHPEIYFDLLENYDNFTDEEIVLIRKLCFYKDTLELCAGALSLHHLCNYLIDLARIFHKFYERCRVIEKSNVVIYPRLLLVMATKIIFNNSLNILGISAPERM